MSIVMENMSCFDFLPTLDDNSIDLVLIDPPYNILEKSWYKDRAHVDNKNFCAWDQEMSIQKLLTELYRVLRDGGTLIMFYQVKFKQIRFIEWVKTNPVPLNSRINYLTTAREIALVAIKMKRGIFNSQYDNGIYQCGICQDKGRFHPTQKPLKLIEQLIRKHSQIGDIVLDCFFGSGTTAAACLNTNRNFVGCEKDETYYLRAKNRIQTLQ